MKVTDLETEGKMEFEITANGQSMTQDMNYTMVYSEDPFFTQMEVSSVDEKIEMYLEEEFAYIFIPENEQWIKANVSDVPEFTEMANGDLLKEDIDRLKEYADLFELEKVKDDYVLTLNVSKENDGKGKEFIAELLTELMSSESGISEENTTINSLEYNLVFDSEFMLKSSEGTVDVQQEVDGDTQQYIAKIGATYTNVNKVADEDLKVPTDITENAIEF